MTQDEIIEMAMEAEFVLHGKPSEEESELFVCVDKDIVRFANLVAAKEREALAQTQEPVAWIHNFIDGGISIGKRPADLKRHPDRWTALYKDPKPCPTCESLARTVMLDQTSHDTTPPQRTEQEPVTSSLVKCVMSARKEFSAIKGESQFCTECHAFERADSWWQEWHGGDIDYITGAVYTHPPQRTEQNFCPRCGKRTNDIHTCTPPQENT